MKKDNSHRLVLNIIILVIYAFILIFMLLGKFLSSSDSVTTSTIEPHVKNYEGGGICVSERLSKETENA